MSGICGIVTKTPKSNCIHLLKAMTNELTHHGPDRCETFVESIFALGHRHLNLMNYCPNTNQPFLYGDRYVIVFDGEIYNGPELRKKLIKETGAIFLSAATITKPPPSKLKI